MIASGQRVQLVHLFETFHEGWDYEPRLTAILKRLNRTRQKLKRAGVRQTLADLALKAAAIHWISQVDRVRYGGVVHVW